MKKFWLFRVEAFEIAGSIALLPLCTEAGHSLTGHVRWQLLVALCSFIWAWTAV
jgi:hypothetical protein